MSFPPKIARVGKKTMTFKQWEIWDARVKFEEINEVKKRPVLIIGVESGVAVALKMTGQAPRGGDEYPVKEWEKSGLKKPTTIRTSKVLRLSSGDFVRKRGSLTLKDRVAFMPILKKYT